ncbi:hypothetical protein AB0869_21140, partial [Micromonospora vinacea]
MKKSLTRALVAIAALLVTIAGLATPAFASHNPNPIDWTVFQHYFGHWGNDVPLRIGQHDLGEVAGFGKDHIMDKHNILPPAYDIQQTIADDKLCNARDDQRIECYNDKTLLRVVYSPNLDTRSGDSLAFGIITAFYTMPCRIAASTPSTATTPTAASTPTTTSTPTTASAAVNADSCEGDDDGGDTDHDVSNAQVDYDGDWFSDMALFRPDAQNGSSWWVRSSRTGSNTHGGTKYGGAKDIPASADYNGDGFTDLALFRPDCTNGSVWNIYSPHTNTQLLSGFKYGGCGDIPAPGDYDGDGRADLALFRRDCSTGSSWSIYSLRTSSSLASGLKYGGCGDIPAPGDYNADGHADLALFRRDCSTGSSWSIYSLRTSSSLASGL